MGGVLQLSEWSAEGLRVWDQVVGHNPVTDALTMSDERVVLDLHVGDRFQRRSQWQEMPARLELRPGDCVRVKAREQVTVPNSALGLICSKASLAADGLYVSNLKVDPQFTGWLEIAVFNASRERIVLSRDMAFASLLFVELRTPMTESLPRIPTETRAVRPSSVKERLRNSLPFVITFVLSVASAVTAHAIFS